MTETILLASADTGYYKRFGLQFINSAIAHGNRVHIHIINPELGLKYIYSELVTYSFESKAPDTREYYAANRFMIAPNILLDYDQTTLLILDIDCIIRKKIELPAAAVGLWFRESIGVNEWEWAGTRVAAGAVMYDETAWLFAKRVAERIEELPKIWFADQRALADTFDEFRFSMNFHDFSKDEPLLLDWTFQEDSAIWTAKGKLKDDPRFLEEKSKYDSL